MSAEVPARSLFDGIVERYVAVTQWPTSRKTALMAGLVAVSLVPILGVTALLTPRLLPNVVDVSRLRPLAATAAVVELGVCALSLIVAARGAEGRWTAYLLALALTPLYQWLFYLYGSMSTPLLALYPVAIVILMLYFDPGVAWFTLFAGMVLELALWVPELRGVIPFAPILIDRGIDAQNTLAWYLNIYIVIQVGLLLPLFLVHFTLAASRMLRHQVAEQHAQVVEAKRNLERANEVIGRYVPAQLAAHILSGDQPKSARPERRKLTLFFSDVAGFTAAADRLEPEDLAGLLNEYLSEMATIADVWGGTIDQFVGDGILIFFGAPDATDDRDHAVRCVKMAIAMQRRMRQLQARWFDAGIEEPFRVRIGINTGMASVGDFGSEGRIAYSAIGAQTNLAARIQGMCTPGRILISHSTWALVHDLFRCTERGSIEAKGFHYPVRVYEVVDDESAPAGAGGAGSKGMAGPAPREETDASSPQCWEAHPGGIAVLEPAVDTRGHLRIPIARAASQDVGPLGPAPADSRWTGIRFDHATPAFPLIPARNRVMSRIPTGPGRLRAGAQEVQIPPGVRVLSSTYAIAE